MPKNVAPPKSVSGAGFHFEDQVVAYYLSCLLIDQPPLDPSMGTISGMTFMVRADGWYLDDLLLTLAFGSATSRLAISVKSNSQFSSAGAPAEFVRLLWEQFLHEGSDKFDKARDRLGMITGPMLAGLGVDIQTLLGLASTADSADLGQRLKQAHFTNDTVRAIYASFACPADLKAKHNVADDACVALLSRLLVMEFDFEQQASTRLNQGMLYCRSALTSGEITEGASLWECLLAFAAELRTKAGHVDRRALLARLRGRFALKELPQYEDDWRRLDQQTQTALGVLPCTIGPTLQIPVAEHVAAMRARLKDSKVLLLVGPSGSGKTVISQKAAGEFQPEGQVIWWSAQSLDSMTFAQFEQSLGLGHTLADVAGNTATGAGYLFLDGVDRVYTNGGIQNVAALIQLFDVLSASSPWHLILSCPPEECTRVQLSLMKHRFSVSPEQLMTIDCPSEGRLHPVWDAFPELRTLRLRPELGQLLGNLKILDLLARNIALLRVADTTRWVGETHFVDWFWSTEIDKGASGPARSLFAMVLATKQGDQMQAAIPKTDFTTEELGAYAELARDHVCREVEGRITFEHDLFGDWARLRFLVENSPSDDPSVFLRGRLASPLWHRAVRLYGVRLLEQNAGPDPWRQALESTPPKTDSPDLCRDLLLEALVFSGNARAHLEAAWGQLLADDGTLLVRLLGRFLHVGTMPNPVIMAMAEESGGDWATQAATLDRHPYWPYWPAMLQVMSRHGTDCIRYAPVQTSRAAGAWLRHMARDWPLRKECAELAIRVAERHYVLDKCDRVHVDNKDLDVVYRAALSAYPELPERVRQLCLLACSRIELSPDNLLTTELIKDLRDRMKSKISIRADDEETPAWSDGPRHRVDDAFQKLCLSTDALRPIMELEPSLAVEIILALLIKPPHSGRHFDDDEPLSDRLEVESHIGEWYPPFYTRGPFLLFLRINPAIGIQLIMRLVHFATDRWAESVRRKGHEPFNIQLAFPAGTANRLVGSGNEFCWYRGATNCPHAVVSALMALEKFLYDRQDAGEPVDELLTTILREARSVALAGVLCAAGRRNVGLFTSTLKPLLASPEFHYCELCFALQADEHLPVDMMGWRRLGQTRESEIERMAREWHTMPHRKHDLHRVALCLFLNNEDMGSFFDAIFTDWTMKLQAGGSPGIPNDDLELFAARFNKANYKTIEDPVEGTCYAFSAPEHLRKKCMDDAQKADESLLLIGSPMTCRRFLNAGAPLSPAQVDRVCRTLDHVAGLPDKADDETGFRRKVQTLCGGAAVLICLNRNWLREHPDRERWCIDQIVNTVENPPLPGEFDMLDTPTDSRWDGFCAEATAILWAEDVQDKRLRKSVALLATSRYYRTVAILAASAARVRQRLGSAHKQLHHLIAGCAVLRWTEQILAAEKYTVSRQRGVRKIFREVSARINVWRAQHADPQHVQYGCDPFTAGSVVLLKRYVRAFMGNRLSCSVPEWETLITKLAHQGLGEKSRRGRRGRSDPGIDMQLLQAAYAWLPRLTEAQTPQEREEWLRFWRLTLSHRLQTLDERDEHGEPEGTPYESDRWVFDHIASAIIEMEPAEKPVELWRPIMDLGPGAHYWVEGFLDAFFIYGLHSVSPPPGFRQQWTAMIDYVASAPGWSLSSEQGFHAPTVWQSLMGLDWVYQTAWDESKRDLVKGMAPYYEAWCNWGLRDRHAVKVFLHFLRTPASDPIVIPSVTWLVNAVPFDSPYFWKDAQTDIAFFLDWCWVNKRPAIRQSAAAMASFMKLLEHLAGMQNAFALVLLERVRSDS